jgi:predicted DsbA family dithiol-disulfide isomerase
MGQPLLIDLVADVVCPWCYLGWRRVKSAVALRPDVEPLIVWRPYQLDPTLPEQGVDRKAHMAGKFKDSLKLKAVHTALVEAGVEEGIVFNFEDIALSPNTSAAHRLIRWAHGAGKQTPWSRDCSWPISRKVATSAIPWCCPRSAKRPAWIRW